MQKKFTAIWMNKYPHVEVAGVIGGGGSFVRSRKSSWKQHKEHIYFHWQNSPLLGSLRGWVWKLQQKSNWNLKPSWKTSPLCSSEEVPYVTPISREGIPQVLWGRSWIWHREPLSLSEAPSLLLHPHGAQDLLLFGSSFILIPEEPGHLYVILRIPPTIRQIWEAFITVEGVWNLWSNKGLDPGSIPLMAVGSWESYLTFWASVSWALKWGWKLLLMH